jgi:hypothetical protein
MHSHPTLDAPLKRPLLVPAEVVLRSAAQHSEDGVQAVDEFRWRQRRRRRSMAPRVSNVLEQRLRHLLWSEHEIHESCGDGARRHAGL